MIDRKVVNRSLYLAAGFVILALTGVFGSFSSLFVIRNLLPLSTVLLLAMVGGTGFYMASLVHDKGRLAMLANSIVGSVIVAALLGFVTLFVYSVSMDGGERLVTIRTWVRFTFPNLSRVMFDVLLFGQGFVVGLLVLLLSAVVLGGLAVGLFILPNKIRGTFFSATGFAIVLGLLQSQLLRIIPLTDALVLILALLPAYLLSLFLPNLSLYVRGAFGLVLGAVVGGVAASLVNSGVISPTQFSIVLTLSPLFAWLLLVGALLGLMGASAGVAPGTFNAGVVYLSSSLIVAGVINWQRGMTLTAFIITYALLAVVAFAIPNLRRQSNAQHEKLAPLQRRINRQVLLVLALTLAFIAPTFLGRSLTFALALVGIYVIMGIGLNIVVGYAGLLDLGHVGFFAIGAYTIGLLTSPTIVTCGVPASDVLVRDVAQVREVQSLDIEQQTGNALFIEDSEAGQLAPINCGIWNFWLALPVAVLAAGSAGMILGVPVLRLRGDYLAIVTLGLSEIISIIIGASTFSDVFGSAQGISPIPSPTIDLTLLNAGWQLEFFSSQIYYLIVPGVLLAVFISQRIVNSRVGRAWRSMRADEDVAEAMGIDLVRSKLSAFGVSAAFAGLGGAFFGAGLQGAFPNSFTLLVSINVLSMIIIGGLGSIPGVIVGALVLVGLPEILRELDDYRLLVFGMLLVSMMLLRPEGLIPPPLRQLTKRASPDAGLQKTSAEPATGD